LSGDYEALKNKPADTWDDYQVKISRLLEAILKGVHSRRNTSAEISSLLKIQAEVNGSVHVTFLASDTILSRLAAEILAEVLGARPEIETGFDVNRDVITDLQVTDHRRFERDGLPNLMSRIEHWLGGYPDDKAINMTGGYKATVPYLTIMAQIHNVPLYYIFDSDGADLIRIPQAPLAVDWQLFVKYNHVLKDLREGIENWDAYRRQHAISEGFHSCIYFDDDCTAQLNAIGEMFWGIFESSFLVPVRYGCGYRSESAGNKAQIKRVLQELYNKICHRFQPEWENIDNTRSICKKIHALPDTDDLRHATVGKDVFIFKSTDRGQHRLLYRPEIIEGLLQVRLIDYDLRPHAGSKDYIETLRRKLDVIDIDQEEYTTITIKKPEVH